jgi:DNA-binding CsgD family transcriptional regulator
MAVNPIRGPAPVDTGSGVYPSLGNPLSGPAPSAAAPAGKRERPTGSERGGRPAKPAQHGPCRDVIPRHASGTSSAHRTAIPTSAGGRSGRWDTMGVRRTTKSSRTSPAMIALAERRAKTLELRRQGRSFQEIAARLGISDRTAHRDVSISMAQIVAEPATHLLQLELLRLDEMQKGFYAAACEGNIAATNMCLRIIDRRAKLLGLYKCDEDGRELPRAPTVKVMLGDRPLAL